MILDYMCVFLFRGITMGMTKSFESRNTTDGDWFTGSKVKCLLHVSNFILWYEVFFTL